MNLRRMLAAAIVVTAISMPAHATWTAEGEALSKGFEQILRDSLNDPDSLKVDSMTIFRVGLREYHACGMLRAKNLHGGYLRQNYVITLAGAMPVYIGPIPLSFFRKDCAGEVIYNR